MSLKSSQSLEDVEEPMPSGPATLKDTGTPYQIVLWVITV